MCPSPSSWSYRRFLDGGETIGDPSVFPLTGLVRGVRKTPLAAPMLSSSSSSIALCSLVAVCSGSLDLFLVEKIGVGGDTLRISGAVCIRLGLGRSGLGVGKSGISVSAAAELDRQAARTESSCGEVTGDVR